MEGRDTCQLSELDLLLIGMKNSLCFSLSLSIYLYTYIIDHLSFYLLSIDRSPTDHFNLCSFVTEMDADVSIELIQLTGRKKEQKKDSTTKRGAAHRAGTTVGVLSLKLSQLVEGEMTSYFLSVPWSSKSKGFSVPLSCSPLLRYIYKCILSRWRARDRGISVCAGRV